MTEYDGTVLRRFAAALYRRAQWIVGVYTAAGAIAGYLLSGIGHLFSSPSAGERLLYMLVLGLVGCWLGNNRAFLLKVAAQLALCQAEIEANTRRARAA